MRTDRHKWASSLANFTSTCREKDKSFILQLFLFIFYEHWDVLSFSLCFLLYLHLKHRDSMKLNNSKPTIQPLDKEVGKSRRITHVAFSYVVKGRITLDFSTTPPAPQSATQPFPQTGYL